MVMGAPGAALAAGLSENTIYTVRTAGLTTDAFTLSATDESGAAVDITAGGSVIFLPFAEVPILAGSEPELAIGSLILQF
jgi:hypothetical protein